MLIFIINSTLKAWYDLHCVERAIKLKPTNRGYKICTKNSGINWKSYVQTFYLDNQNSSRSSIVQFYKIVIN